MTNSDRATNAANEILDAIKIDGCITLNSYGRRVKEIEKMFIQAQREILDKVIPVLAYYGDKESISNLIAAGCGEADCDDFDLEEYTVNWVGKPPSKGHKHIYGKRARELLAELRKIHCEDK